MARQTPTSSQHLSTGAGSPGGGEEEEEGCSPLGCPLFPALAEGLLWGAKWPPPPPPPPAPARQRVGSAQEAPLQAWPLCPSSLSQGSLPQEPCRVALREASFP